MNAFKSITVCLLLVATNLSFAATERVPGTSVLITPPDGFGLSTFFTGYISSASGATIVVTELEGASANELEEIYSPSGMAEFGMRFLGKRNVSLGGSKGTLLEAEQRDTGTVSHRWILVFENERSTIMVVGMIPNSRPSKEHEAIKRALLSCRNSVEGPNDSSEALGFTVAGSGDLKVATRIQNNLVFTLHGTLPNREKGAPYAVFGKSLARFPIAPDELSDFAKNRLLQTAKFEDIYVIDEEPLRIADLQAHYLVGEGFHEDTGVRTSIDQCIIISGKEYYIFQAIVTSDQRSTYAEAFMDILYSFKQSKLVEVPNIVGFWKSEMVDGYRLEFSFNADGTALWSLPPEGQARCKYATSAGTSYPQIDVYDFEMPDSDGIRFRAIYSIEGDELRIDGVPTKYGLAEDGSVAVRPTSFGDNMVLLKRHP